MGAAPGTREYGGLADRLSRIEKRLADLERGNRLPSASVGSGGLTIRDDGKITFLDSVGEPMGSVSATGMSFLDDAGLERWASWTSYRAAVAADATSGTMTTTNWESICNFWLPLATCAGGIFGYDYSVSDPATEGELQIVFRTADGGSDQTLATVNVQHGATGGGTGSVSWGAPTGDILPRHWPYLELQGRLTAGAGSISVAMKRPALVY